jgi:hypothetical protein
MMRDTPRTFVGPVLFLLDGPVCGHLDEEVRTAVAALPGIERCEVDIDAGTLVVSAREPVDRTDVVAVLDRLGCPIRT